MLCVQASNTSGFDSSGTQRIVAMILAAQRDADELAEWMDARAVVSWASAANTFRHVQRLQASDATSEPQSRSLPERARVATRECSSCARPTASERVSDVSAAALGLARATCARRRTDHSHALHRSLPAAFARTSARHHAQGWPDRVARGDVSTRQRLGGTAASRRRSLAHADAVARAGAQLKLPSEVAPQARVDARRLGPHSQSSARAHRRCVEDVPTAV